MRFFDKSVVVGVKRRESDGALLADARIARTGVQLYLGKEVDPKNEHGFRDKSVVRVYRPASEVFSQDTMASAAHRPVTNDHHGLINVDNWKQHAVGQTADEVSGEGIYLRVPLMVSDAATIADIENGKRELSAGYESILDWTSGTTPAGEDYDAVQRDIRINHVAIVQRGRAGSAVRIGDSAWGASPVEDGEDEGVHTMADKPLKTVTVDGLSIETTDQGAQVIEKLQRQIADANTASAKVLQDHATALADKDRELAKKDAEIDDLKKKVLSDADLDKRVAARADLVAKAKTVHADLKPEGLSDADIRRAVVTAKLGDAAVKDKADAYIEARFDGLVESVGKEQTTQDTFRSATVQDGAAPPANKDDPRVSAYADMLQSFHQPFAEPGKAN